MRDHHMKMLRLRSSIENGISPERGDFDVPLSVEFYLCTLISIVIGIDGSSYNLGFQKLAYFFNTNQNGLLN